MSDLSWTTIRYTEKIILQCVIMFRVCEKSLTPDLHPVVLFERRAGVFYDVFQAALDEFQKENPNEEAARHFPHAVSEIVFCLQNMEETEKLVADNHDYAVPVAGLGMMAIKAYRKLDAEEGGSISLPGPTILPKPDHQNPTS